MKLLRYHPRIPNFGDDLNSELWPLLSPSLFADGDDDADIAMVGIGTIIGIDPGCSRKLHVFSSGAGYTSADKWAGCSVEYHCVRGPLTARILNLDRRKALTDGAILTPLVKKYRTDGRGTGTIVIPHYETLSYPGWEEAISMAGFRLADPRRSPDEVISDIACADHVLTESLHGAILADTFGIPWKSFSVSRNFSIAKWTDWCTSVAVDGGVTMVPPPEALQLLEHGKPEAPFGSCLPFDPEIAIKEFRHRIAPSPSRRIIRDKVKDLMKALPLARRALGFSAERTAEALAELIKQEPNLSTAAKRDELQDAMMVRLAALAARYGASVSLGNEATASRLSENSGMKVRG